MLAKSFSLFGLPPSNKPKNNNWLVCLPAEWKHGVWRKVQTDEREIVDVWNSLLFAVRDLFWLFQIVFLSFVHGITGKGQRPAKVL